MHPLSPELRPGLTALFLAAILNANCLQAAHCDYQPSARELWIIQHKMPKGTKIAGRHNQGAGASGGKPSVIHVRHIRPASKPETTPEKNPAHKTASPTSKSKSPQDFVRKLDKQIFVSQGWVKSWSALPGAFLDLYDRGVSSKDIAALFQDKRVTWQAKITNMDFAKLTVTVRDPLSVKVTSGKGTSAALSPLVLHFKDSAEMKKNLSRVDASRDILFSAVLKSDGAAPALSLAKTPQGNMLNVRTEGAEILKNVKGFAE